MAAPKKSRQGAPAPRVSFKGASIPTEPEAKVSFKGARGGPRLASLAAGIDLKRGWRPSRGRAVGIEVDR